MSKIRDKVEQDVNDALRILRRKLETEHYDFHYDAQLEALETILSIPELAIVDREAELPQCLISGGSMDCGDRGDLRQGAEWMRDTMLKAGFKYKIIED